MLAQSRICSSRTSEGQRLLLEAPWDQVESWGKGRMHGAGRVAPGVGAGSLWDSRPIRKIRFRERSKARPGLGRGEPTGLAAATG